MRCSVYRPNPKKPAFILQPESGPVRQSLWQIFPFLKNNLPCDSRGLQQATARLEAQRQSWVEVLPSDRVRELAETLPEQYGLRALDSFQLAAALVWSKEQPRGRLFVCCDVRLTEAATKAGFDVMP